MTDVVGGEAVENIATVGDLASDRRIDWVQQRLVDQKRHELLMRWCDCLWVSDAKKRKGENENEVCLSFPRPRTFAALRVATAEGARTLGKSQDRPSTSKTMSPSLCTRGAVQPKGKEESVSATSNSDRPEVAHDGNNSARRTQAE
jgi:hypothetical protein